ncbi:Peroxisomal membrane anchor protein (peroxin) [Ceraceosorus bombacis]|uniref:Peroxisomal membrane protein PEX14 n=1 Tax=Ceraceosorus bombacis TaxID=401625 RepID=A0A0P1BQ94_9BASI|nr:Peroxisomal membrane anchor protein (peroxin) [Ceraceosorus bombacis]
MSASTNAAPRADMVQSAVSFLLDPAVSTSTMDQRLQFLSSKGLTQSEIQEALRLSSTTTTSSTHLSPAPSAQGQVGPFQPQSYAQSAPYYAAPAGQYAYGQPNQRANDWRDWFIMAVVAGTAGYGVMSLARPPNADVLTTDLESLTAKYDAVSSQLSALEETTESVKVGVEEQRKAVDQGIKEVESAVDLIKKGETRRDDEIRKVVDEVEEIKKSLPKMFEKTQSAQAQSLSDLQSELKSLKSLLVSRGGAGAGAGTGASRYSSGVGGPSSGTSGGRDSPALGFKPSIPAWQLAGGSGSGASAAGSGTESNTPAKDAKVGATSASSDEEKSVQRGLQKGGASGEESATGAYSIPS